MCGIFGAVTLSEGRLEHGGTMEAMGAALGHRGPDAHRVVDTPQAALGIERLRIIDLDPRADQPFASPDSRYWIVCNGEIYNAPELRARYADYPFLSGSDVESALPVLMAMGAAGIRELDGMFGLAFWDAHERRLLLGRDRAGEKPLYYMRRGGEVWFASEPQSLLEIPGVSRELDREAIAQYLALGYVVAPRTMFAAIRRVEPGTVVCFESSGTRVQRYWNAADFEESPLSPRQAVSRLRELLEEAVRKQSVADVRIGVFTSGGLDSSILATLAARRLGAANVHTFAARFSAESFDESPVAAEVARALGTRHVEVPCTEETLGEALREAVQRVAEPLGDPALLPVILLGREARRHVTVILSGEGADELFGGYPTYLGHKVAPWLLALPRGSRAALRSLVNRLPSSGRKVTVEYLLKRFMADLEAPWPERHLNWFGTGFASLDGVQPGTLADILASRDRRGDLRGAMLLDYLTYLPDDLLFKVDRGLMLHSVEARAPFLDRDVTAFALSLPAAMRVRGFTTKWLLKKAAAAWLPADVINRRKRGLGVPVADWMRRGLRPEVGRLLHTDRLAAQGILDATLVGGLVAEHNSGAANHARALWPLIMLQYWLERWT